MTSNKLRVGTVRLSDVAAHPTMRMDAEFWLDRADELDSIKAGDRVSWRFDDENRCYGTMVRRTTSEFRPAFVVQNARGNKQTIVPARFVTKECG